MDHGPLFSVVIPTYNRELFIEKTLQSVFEQTYSNYEIIVVDNCSTDNTVKILEPYIKAGRIRFIQHERNLERAQSRNTGMENACGDFLTLLDSDDFMFENNLADAAQFIRSHPESKVFHNLYYLVDGNRNLLRKYRFPAFNDQLRAITHGNFMSCIGSFMHRDVYKNYRFDTFPDLTGAEDWYFWLTVLARFKLGRIDKYNSGIQHHAGRTVKTKHFETLESGYRYMFNKIRSDKELSKIYANYLDRIEATSYMYLAVLANTGGFFADARRYLRLAWHADPRISFSFRFLNIWRRALLRLQIK